MKSIASRSLAKRLDAKDCRRASLIKPGARVSGTQICTGRNPAARSRERYLRILFTDREDRAGDSEVLVFVRIAINHLGNMLPQTRRLGRAAS